MTTISASEQLLLLDLPLEVRLRIYSIYFACHPVWISKVQKKDCPGYGEQPVKHTSCRLYAKSFNLLKTCTQVYGEAKPLFFAKSLFNFALDVKYRRRVNPQDIPDTILASIRSVVCYSSCVDDWLQSKKNLELEIKSDLQQIKPFDTVTLMDTSYLLFSLTQHHNGCSACILGGHIPISSSKYVNCCILRTRHNVEKLANLGHAVASLRQAAVKTVIIQSRKSNVKGREIGLHFDQSSINSCEQAANVTVVGVPSHWEKTARTVIKALLLPDLQTVTFNFLASNERLQPAIVTSDYFAASIAPERLVRRLNVALEHVGHSERAFVEKGKVLLCNRVVPEDMVWRLERDMDKIDPGDWFERRYQTLIMRRYGTPVPIGYDKISTSSVFSSLALRPAYPVE